MARSTTELTRMRNVLAQHAAKLMLEEGIADFGFAKKKAARQLNITGRQALPSNLEIRQALESLSLMFFPDQETQMTTLRHEALAVMEYFADFSPHLAGWIAGKTLLANCPIEIHLFADSSKEVEILLLNKGIVFERSERRCRFPDHYRNIPLLKLTTPKAEVELIVFALNDLKVPLLDACGEKSPRIDREKLHALIKA
jgi:hypothetical protein